MAMQQKSIHELNTTRPEFDTAMGSAALHKILSRGTHHPRYNYTQDFSQRICLSSKMPSIQTKQQNHKIYNKSVSFPWLMDKMTMCASSP